MRKTGIFIVAALIAVGVAEAHQGVKNKAVMARMDGMLASKQAVKTLGDMAAGKTTFDAAAASAAKARLIEEAQHTPTLFEEPASDPMTEALPKLWDNWEDFLGKSEAALTAAQQIDTGSVATLQQSLIPLGAACLDCHKSYRRARK